MLWSLAEMGVASNGLQERISVSFNSARAHSMNCEHTRRSWWAGLSHFLQAPIGSHHIGGNRGGLCKLTANLFEGVQQVPRRRVCGELSPFHGGFFRERSWKAHLKVFFLSLAQSPSVAAQVQLGVGEFSSSNDPCHTLVLQRS